MKEFLADLTRTHDTNPDNARVEYALRINLIILSLFTAGSTLIALFAYLRKIILLDTLLIIALLALLSSITLFFTFRGYWQKMRLFPVTVFFLIAVYGNFVGGIGAPAMLIYVLSIVLAMQLYGRTMQYIIIAAAMLSYITIAGLHWKGVIAAPRSEASTFLNRVFIAALIMLAIGALLRFIVSQLEKSIAISRKNERELAAANEALLAANKQYERVNRDLEKSEDNFRTLFESTPIPVFLHREGIILFANQAFSQMVGEASREAVIGASIFDYIVPEEKPRVLKMAKNQQQVGDAPLADEILGIRADGKSFDCEVNIAFVMLDDGPATLVLGQDVTDRKTAEKEKERMQRQLLQAQKMEAVGTLTGGIAHDFNNMLAGIIGSLNLIELRLKKENNPANDSLEKHLETALEAAGRAADMTRQLLTLSRKSELKLAPVDVNLSLNHIRKLCQNSFPKSVGLEFRTAKEPLIVLADPVQIEQALLNLCVNASHAMTIMRSENETPGGVLTVSTERLSCDDAFRLLHPDARPGGTCVLIRVCDNGVGMDEETRLQIFDPFFSTKGQQEGTGLGLAMAYGIVTQHRGFIEVDSEPGKGSTFNVFLPAMEK
ncbi:ATP-binding protein [Breoghania sp.]|uniref:two-component system sensor histidine kinase NtrB n=1 Tax=Breoghania sp. TaxID=2065378 RepID=UPI0029C80FC5|nr:ATP-binding protein [Breoghania sp.]